MISYNDKSIKDKELNSNNLYDRIDFLESELQFYKRLHRQIIINFIKNEIDILKNIKIEIDKNSDKKNLLNVLFLLKIYSNIIEDIPLNSNFNTNWEDLLYFSAMESPSPESLINNTIKEIKRKRSYSSTRFISKIIRKIHYNEVNNLELKKNINKKQLSLDIFI